MKKLTPEQVKEREAQRWQREYATRKAEAAAVRDRLGIKAGETIYTKLIHVSRSGMYRAIDLYIMRDNRPVCISYAVAPLLEGYDTRHDGCRAHGCGMDMGFHLVYNLSSIMFPDGFKCVGKGTEENGWHYCPSNDHSNGMAYTPDYLHKSGDYALRQEWF